MRVGMCAVHMKKWDESILELRNRSDFDLTSGDLV